MSGRYVIPGRIFKPNFKTDLKGKKMDVDEKMMTKGLLIDGAMGSMLISQGLTGAQAPELWNIEHPYRIQAVHTAYCDAGADVITANTYGACAIKLEKMGVSKSVAEINQAGVGLARQACTNGQYVAGDMGSLGDMLEPAGPVSIDRAVECFAEQAGILDEAGVDLFLIETVFDLNLAVAAIRAIRQVSGRPVFCSMTFKQMKKGFFTIFGNGVEDSVKALEQAGASAVGANCSIGSRVMVELAGEIKRVAKVPVIVQPNAGLPEVKADNTVFYPEDESFFAESIRMIKELGVEIVGGCCGTTPDYIRKIRQVI